LFYISKNNVLSMGQVEEIVIVGGGPAGAYCALELARKGIYATVFDHSHPREKPCAGGLTQTVLEKFPFVEEYRVNSGTSSQLRILSCSNKEVSLNPNPGFNVSREFFDYQILKKAEQNGAKLSQEKVLAVQSKENYWLIRTAKQSFAAKIVVGADGVCSLIRRVTVGPMRKENLQLTFGYLITGLEDEPTTIRFLAEIPNYIWIFPRKDHSSVGISGDLQFGSWLKGRLNTFMYSYPQAKITSSFAALIPCAKNPDFFNLPCSGADWVLIGDAAGHVDPISGEGILYALWSAKLAAEAIANHDLEAFDSLWRSEYGNDLAQRSLEREKFYNPERIELMALMSQLNRTDKNNILDQP
jgi:geranylgeranyl reductase family protein